MSGVIENTPDDNLVEGQCSISPEIFTGLMISRYEIRLRAAQEATIPIFPGSTLRGTFGHALKQAVCVMTHRDCERCLVAGSCIYPYVFETPVPPDLQILRNQRNAPHPFVLDPPVYHHHLKESGDGSTRQWEKYHTLVAGDEIVFGLALMGRAIEYFPYVVYAIQEMAQRGMGRGRTQFVLSEVSSIEVGGRRRAVYTESSQRLDAPEDASDLSEWVAAGMAQSKKESPGDQNGDQDGGDRDLLKLRFITPTRIKTHNDLHPEIDFGLLVRNLMRRLSMLMAVHGERQLELDFHGLLARAGAVSTVISSLKWWDWVRYSARQQTKMRLGGLVGEIVYQGRAIAECWPLLVAGEILRVGSGTGFGLGRYELL